MIVFGFLPAVAGEAGYFMEALLLSASRAGLGFLRRVAATAGSRSRIIFGRKGDCLAVVGALPHILLLSMAGLTGLKTGTDSSDCLAVFV